MDKLPKWEVVDVDPAGNPANVGRVFVTNGLEAFHVDATGAQHLADLLDAGATPRRESRAEMQAANLAEEKAASE